MAKKSWDYQKQKNYKQMKFILDLDDHDEQMIYYYLTTRVSNRSALIKKLLLEEIARAAYEEA